jgi:hypothetical protein
VTSVVIDSVDVVYRLLVTKVVPNPPYSCGSPRGSVVFHHVRVDVLFELLAA